MTIETLPTINASLNATCAVLLICGLVAIKRGRKEIHMRFMLGATLMSILFLISYLLYHAQVGSVPYPYHDWTRPIYFAILIPHVLGAAILAPCVVVLLSRAWRGDFENHKRLARKVWPLWMYVSVSGITVYLMLYRL